VCTDGQIKATIIFFAFPSILVIMSIICCATTEKSLDDNDDLLSMGPRFRLKKGYTRSDMASTRGFQQSQKSQSRQIKERPNTDNLDEDYGQEMRQFEFDEEKDFPEKIKTKEKGGVLPGPLESDDSHVGTRVERSIKRMIHGAVAV
jgi:hypothetical protein